MNYFMDKNHFGNEKGSDRENRPVAWKRDARVDTAHTLAVRHARHVSTHQAIFAVARIPEQKERLLVD